MSQTLLFGIGACVFAVTLWASLSYGYVLFSRLYEADLEEELAVKLAAEQVAVDEREAVAGSVSPAMP